MNQAVIAVGGNIDPERWIAQARARVAAAHRLVAESPFVWTKPIGPIPQPDFLNGAWRIETELGRDALVDWLHALEVECGRVRTPENKWGPRTLDLDLVVWNGEVVDDDVYQRDFLYEAVKAVWGFSTFGKGLSL